MRRLTAIAFLLAAVVSAQQEYKGPLPPEKNILYLVQGGNLVETEVTVAQPYETDDVSTYIIPGAKSPVHTAISKPTLIIQSDSMIVRKLRLFHMQVKDGHREISFRAGDLEDAEPLEISITQVSSTLYRIMVADSLSPGEYSLSPDGTNDAFCFGVY